MDGEEGQGGWERRHETHSKNIQHPDTTPNPVPTSGAQGHSGKEGREAGREGEGRTEGLAGTAQDHCLQPCDLGQVAPALKPGFLFCHGNDNTFLKRYLGGPHQIM